MTYTFGAHTALIRPPPSESNSAGAQTRAFALIDAAQLKGRMKKPLQRVVPNALGALLFEETFAKSALDLSPVLFALSDDPGLLVEQISALDAVCHQLPVMSILHSTLALGQLVEHLRGLLLIEADEAPYLLRFADSQMLVAVNSVLTSAQRASFFSGVQSWFIVDHQARLHDAADRRLNERTIPGVQLSLKLDAAQTHALLDAAAIPALASQVRNLEPTFEQKLSHAQQTEFISTCVAAATEAGITDDTEFTLLALERWRAEEQRRA